MTSTAVYRTDPRIEMTNATPERASRAQAREGTARTRLLNAALTAFASRGFHGTGTRDIAKSAGLSPAAVYVHYSSKEELLYSLSLAGHRHVHQVVEEAVVKDSTPDAQLRAVVRAYVAWHARFHTTARVVQYEMASLEPAHAAEIARIRRAIESRVRELVHAGITSGYFRTGSPRMAVLAILSLGIDVARWYRDDGAWSPNQIGQHYSELALNMVGWVQT